MKNNALLCLLTGLLIASPIAYAQDQTNTGNIPVVSEEDQQRINHRMANLTADDQNRYNERLSSVAEASKTAAAAASAGAPAANPACEIVLCMFGKLSGKSQSQCKSAEKEYFSIQVWKKGKIRWSQTASKRLSLLNGCPSPENQNINKKFGKVFG